MPKPRPNAYPTSATSPEPKEQKLKVADCIDGGVMLYPSSSTDSVQAELRVTNLSKWPISGWKCSISGENGFKELLFEGSVESYQPIQPGETINVTKYFHLNQFIDRDMLFARTPADQVYTGIDFDKVEFADGTVLDE